MAMSAAATSAVSRVSSASDQSNRLDACSARSTTRCVGGFWGTSDTVSPTGAPGSEAGVSSVARASATARATPCVRDAGLGLPVTTAIRMASYLRSRTAGSGADTQLVRPEREVYDAAAGWRGRSAGGARGHVQRVVESVWVGVLP